MQISVSLVHVKLLLWISTAVVFTNRAIGAIPSIIQASSKTYLSNFLLDILLCNISPCRVFNSRNVFVKERIFWCLIWCCNRWKNYSYDSQNPFMNSTVCARTTICHPLYNRIVYISHKSAVKSRDVRLCFLVWIQFSSNQSS